MENIDNALNKVRLKDIIKLQKGGRKFLINRKLKAVLVEVDRRVAEKRRIREEKLKQEMEERLRKEKEEREMKHRASMLEKNKLNSKSTYGTNASYNSKSAHQILARRSNFYAINSDAFQETIEESEFENYQSNQSNNNDIHDVIKQSLDEGFSATDKLFTDMKSRSNSNMSKRDVINDLKMQSGMVPEIKININSLSDESLNNVQERSRELVNNTYDITQKIKNFNINFNKASIEARYGDLEKITIYYNKCYTICKETFTLLGHKVEFEKCNRLKVSETV